MEPPSRDTDRPAPVRQGRSSLETRLEGILDAIENEKVPERLLRLAVTLQEELAARRKRRNPD